jgi:hypothetical protein
MIFIGMENLKELISNLLGKIYLKKSTMFGLDSQKITLIVSPSMKIFGVYSSPERLKNKFPFQKDRFLDPKILRQWANENGYEISFKTNVPSLNRQLYLQFGDAMNEEVNDKNRELSVLVMEELEKSQLPKSIKEWAKNNPEKFIKSIETIQEILKK